jgi:hypothetical protein
MFVYTWISGDLHFCRVLLEKEVIENIYFIAVFARRPCLEEG